MHQLCNTRKNFPYRSHSEDCPECVLHLKGPSKKRQPASTLYKWYDDLFLNSSQDNSWSDEAQFVLRCFWLSLLYAAGWTEEQFDKFVERGILPPQEKALC